MKLADRFVQHVFGRQIAHLVDERVRQAAQVLDGGGQERYWHDLTRPSYLARPWHEHRDLLERIRRACDRNPLAARLVGLTTDFVVGSGAQVEGDGWAMAFWNHPQNRIDRRVYRWCDELTRAGELFIVLSRNMADGMSYVREVPAYLIDRIETDPDDLERE
ncbi:MAG: hypothetical protein H5U01_14220, partial [Clostridia bacterium]|nr:hypothetical protein [Clostridia bacterium]